MAQATLPEAQRNESIMPADRLQVVPQALRAIAKNPFDQGNSQICDFI
ncbi:MAG: hypothetical protein HY785_02485 [Oscillatoriophycideae cyanobacterium NC_groundwater_1537_Pr4_S-0.65um_50_18]|nr:hypothetical protein [Oscillatoriophycideae cyanobacterium NC_groundwater_1537_Pr4_S-0.65um_50_18]